jgi:pyruvate dehydrogenase E1 component beta subunit
MIAAIRDDNPTIFVEHRLLYPTEAYVPEEPFTVDFGRARVAVEGSDITIVGVSNMVMECLRAQELLAHVGIHAEIIDPITLAPLDTMTIASSVQKTGRLLVVDNAWLPCGAGAEIMASVVETLGPRSGVAMARMGFASTPCPPSPPLEREFYPNPAKIAARAHSMVRENAPYWEPDAESAALSYQLQFRGPF